MMLSLLLCVGLALAEPDPAILPPEPVTYPAEVTVADEAAPGPAFESAPDPEPDPVEPKPPTQFQRLITGIGWIIGLVIGAPYNDEAFVIIVGGLLGEVRLWIDRRKRGRHPAPDQPASKRRPPASERLLAESEIRQISEKIRAEVEHQHQRQINRLDHKSAVLSAALIDFLGEQAAQELIALAGQTPNHDGAEP